MRYKELSLGELVSFVSKGIPPKYTEIKTTITAILSAVLIFLDIPNQWRIASGVVYVSFLSVTYVFLWIRANRLRQVDIKIGTTTVVVKSGDIFEEDGLKAIAFNEYFDTTVDDKIIAKKSLKILSIIMCKHSSRVEEC